MQHSNLLQEADAQYKMLYGCVYDIDMVTHSCYFSCLKEAMST